jgi:hypothetical protein
MESTHGTRRYQPANDHLMVKDHKPWRRIGPLAFCISTLLAVNLDAQVSTTSTSAPATVSKKAFAAASVHALPGLKCKIRPTGSETSSGVPVFTDDDGYARFYAVRPADGDAVQRLSLDCADAGGTQFSYSVDLTSDETFTPHPVDLANERGTDRPALTSDPLSYSQGELIHAGYGLRPDPEKEPAEYSRWLTSASARGRFLEAKRPSAESHGVTSQEAPWWVGSVLAGKPNYVSTSAVFNVPTGIPGGDGTTTTEIAIWNGLGGFNSGSGLIQGGVNVYTTPTVASYGSWREYCCGDPNSSGNGGQFVPSPGDTIYSQAWYCDANGYVDINGGYGCTYLHDISSGAILNCTSPDGSPCSSVKALPLCAVSPQTPNCMTLGTTAEFIIEDQSPQVLASSTAFTDFTPRVTISGSAFSTTTNTSQFISTDPSVYLLTDFTNTTTHIDVSLGTQDETYFSVSPKAAPWNQFEITAGCKASTVSGLKGVSRIPNSMEIWWICGDGSVWDGYWYEGQTQWNQFQISGPGSASVNGRISAVSRQPNTMEIFWVRPDGGVQDAYWYEGQPQWNQFQIAGPGSASINGEISVVSRQPNTMELFWVRPDGGVQDAYWYEGQPQWNQFQIAGPASASINGGITAVSRRPNTLELFWIRPDGAVQDAYWYEGQPQWNQFQLADPGSASVKGGITVVSRQPNTMELFFVRPDGSVRDAYWYEGQPQWNQFEISGPVTASIDARISAVSRLPNTMELWWVRPDGGVQDAYWYEGQPQWNQFQIADPGSAAVSGGVSAVSRKTDTMELWWVRPSGDVQDAYWYER